MAFELELGIRIAGGSRSEGVKVIQSVELLDKHMSRPVPLHMRNGALAASMERGIIVFG